MTIQFVTRGRSHGCGQRRALAIMTAAGVALMCGCGAAQAPAGATPRSGHAVTSAGTLPPSVMPAGVMPAAQACRLVTGREPRGFFTDIEQVHLVLTTYAKGEPVESQGDISTGMAPRTLVWVVEVHARAIHWNHSVPASVPAAAPSQGAAPARAALVYTDYSVVINARTGYGSDAGECNCWPLPLRQAGILISLPAGC
jgi:hypothetical protein